LKSVCGKVKLIRVFGVRRTADATGTQASQSHPPSATDHEQRTTNDSVS